jgi:hypothetical protein
VGGATRVLEHGGTECRGVLAASGADDPDAPNPMEPFGGLMCLFPRPAVPQQSLELVGLRADVAFEARVPRLV